MPRILLLAAALAACRQQPAPSAEENAGVEAAPTLPAVPRPEPPLDRAALLSAVAQAASVAAAGAGPTDGVRSLDGRQFEMRIRFGCRGPSLQLKDEWLGWAFDQENRTLRVRAKPNISKDDPLVMAIAGEEFEAVEGFWIPRPWLLQAVCPASAAVQPAADRPQTAAGAPVAEPLPAGPRVGIAQFFTSDDPRTGQRQMRAYENVQTVPGDKPIGSPQGFNLVLAGRLRALPGRGAIECSARDVDSPPDCVISAEFQRVWIERPENGEVLAEWGGG